MSSKVFKTPLGWAGVAASGQGISSVILPRESKTSVKKELDSLERAPISRSKPAPANQSRRRRNRRLQRVELLDSAVRLLQKYFSGHSPLFDLPLDFHGYTPFQRSAWKACARIPFGETRSYAWIARRIGKPLAARAVGQAMGANPVPIIIP